MRFFLIVEDKPEELEKAVLAIKKKMGISDNDTPMKIIDTGGYAIQQMENYCIATAIDMESVIKVLGVIRNLPVFFGKNDLHVLTDLMFPRHKDGVERANGIDVVLIAIERGFPVAVCSDIDYHEIEWLHRLLDHLRECHPESNINAPIDEKNWETAVKMVLGEWD